MKNSIKHILKFISVFISILNKAIQSFSLKILGNRNYKKTQKLYVFQNKKVTIYYLLTFYPIYQCIVLSK